LIPVSLGPLEEFEIVLHLAFDELFDIDWPIDVMSLEAALKNFEVLKVRVLRVHVELDSRHGNIEIDTVEDLT